MSLWEISLLCSRNNFVRNQAVRLSAGISEGAEGIRGSLSSCILGKPRMKSRYLEILKLEYDILCGSGVAMGTGEEEIEWFWITGNQDQVSDVVDDERQKERWGVRLFKWWSSTKTAACSQMGLVRARRLEPERGQVFKVFKVFS